MSDVLLAIDPDRVKPGWIGLIVVLAIGIATFLLWRSMNHQLGKVNFDDSGDGAENGAGSADGDGPANGQGPANGAPTKHTT